MPKELVIDGRNYQPSAVLARQFSYTSDYLGKLARDGKVEATKVGRQWFISEESLSVFLVELANKKAERNTALREERKLERQNVQVEVEEKKVEEKVLPLELPSFSTAIAETLVIVMCGWLVGFLGYVVYEENIEVASLLDGVVEGAVEIERSVIASSVPKGLGEQVAFLDFSAFLDWLFLSKEVAEDTSGVTTTEITDKENNYLPYRTEQSEGQRQAQPTTSQLYMAGVGSSTTTIQKIKDAFSDEVVVTFDGTDTGMIKPVFRRETDEVYRFVLVPEIEDLQESDI